MTRAARLFGFLGTALLVLLGTLPAYAQFDSAQISGVVQDRTGAVLPGVDVTLENVGTKQQGGGQQLYEMVGDPSAVRTDWDGSRAIWFDRTAFRAPAPGTYATTQPKNTLRQPGFWDLHMSLRKTFEVGGVRRFELRMEAFNVLNRTRLGNAVTNPTNLADFGAITSRVGNRTIQVGMQYVF